MEQARLYALKEGAKHYTSAKVCKHGHTVRYACNSNCVVCSKQRATEDAKALRDQRRAIRAGLAAQHDQLRAKIERGEPVSRHDARRAGLSYYLEHGECSEGHFMPWRSVKDGACLPCHRKQTLDLLA